VSCSDLKSMLSSKATGVAVAEVRARFGNPEESECLPLES
jgi:hypothetical protein